MTRLSVALVLALISGSIAHANPTRVVVVGIDAKTQAELGPFGGSYRAYHAELIKKLDAAGVKGIAMGISFSENPSQAAATKAIADAAKGSKAPVVIGVYMEETPDGITKYPNAKVLQDAKIGQGTVLARREMVAREAGDVTEIETGEVTILSGAAGHRSIVEELMLRTTPLKAGALDRLGLVEDVPTGMTRSRGKTQYNATRAMRPNVDAQPLTLSYVDVLRKGPHPDLKGALVVVGMNDNVNGVHQAPNPKKPGIKRVSGVFLHAALLKRLLREVPRKLAEEKAALAKAKVAQTGKLPLFPKPAGKRGGLIRGMEQAQGPK